MAPETATAHAQIEGLAKARFVRVSPESSALRSALAIALRNTFSMSCAMRFLVKRSVCSASSAR